MNLDELLALLESVRESAALLRQQITEANNELRQIKEAK